MSQESSKLHKFSNGEVRLWAEVGGPIMLISVDPHGDPIELTADEARRLAEALLALAAWTNAT